MATTTSRRPSVSPVSRQTLPVSRARREIGRRSVTTSGLPTPSKNRAAASPSSPLSVSSGPPSSLPTPSRTIRKTTGIGSFPLPPTLRNGPPTSPLSVTTFSEAAEAALRRPSAPETGLQASGYQEGKLRTTGTSETKWPSAETSEGDARGNVLVSVRVRPGAEASTDYAIDGTRGVVSCRSRDGGEFRYDNVFTPGDNNARVYDDAAKRLVRRVMNGYNGTVFAYGTTGTGKTFSMQGTAMSPGLIPLAITDIFSYIREHPRREFLLRVSYLEIYNEKIFDLLGTPGSQTDEIKLREDAKRGVFATPLKEEIVQSPNQLLRMIARGDQARRVASTAANARSSRSHAVVQIVIESRERAGQNDEPRAGRRDRILPGGVLVSTLSLIDLAGSERAADQKERRTEGGHINKSLLTLGTIIGRLSEDDGGGRRYLPYRDSKLTRLLQPALSGDSLVSILCTIQLSSVGQTETLNTLKFASRAKNNIISHAKRNESTPMAGGSALLERYRLEIQELRSQLQAQNRAKEEAEQRAAMEEDRKVEAELERQERTRHQEQLLEMQLARTALKERISHLNRLILSSKSQGVNSVRFSRAVSAPYNGHASGLWSGGSVVSGFMPAAAISHATEEADDDFFDDCEADHTQQIRMLRADLYDKNSYITALERRLKQKDEEMNELRAKLEFPDSHCVSRASSGVVNFSRTPLSPVKGGAVVISSPNSSADHRNTDEMHRLIKEMMEDAAP